MTTQLNTWSDISSIARLIQEDAVFIERDTNFMSQIVTTFGDMSGGNLRKNYQYNAGTAKSIGESDDLTSDAFTPSLLNTLTPGEIGEQFFLTDLRVESDAPERIRTDAAQELGFAARDKIETDLLGTFSSLTGGTVGAAGTVINWSYVFAAATLARAAAKNRSMPLYCVVHEYQWHVLAKATSVAGITLQTVPDRLVGPGGSWYVGSAAGITFYATTNITVDTNTDAVGGMFMKPALALDVRRPIRVEPERDASRRGYEFNMSAVYAYGVWRPKFGVKMIFDAATPTGA
jgi:hypothetical protein